MGKVLLKQGRDVDAAREFGQALQMDPDNFQTLSYVAGVLAANEHSQGRDGELALSLATRANNITSGTQPIVLDVLGMAYAETGDFANAQAMVQKAIELAAPAKIKLLRCKNVWNSIKTAGLGANRSWPPMRHLTNFLKIKSPCQRL